MSRVGTISFDDFYSYLTLLVIKMMMYTGLSQEVVEHKIKELSETGETL